MTGFPGLFKTDYHPQSLPLHVVSRGIADGKRTGMYSQRVLKRPGKPGPVIGKFQDPLRFR